MESIFFISNFHNLINRHICFVIQLFTDGWFLEAMDQYLELRLSHKNIAATYVYLFTHKGSASFTEIFEGGQENYWGKSNDISKI